MNINERPSGDLKSKLSNILSLCARRRCAPDFSAVPKVAAAHPGRIAVVPVDLADLMSRLRRYEAAMKPGSYFPSYDALVQACKNTRRSHRDIPPGRQKFVMLGRLAIEAMASAAKAFNFYSSIGLTSAEHVPSLQASGAKQVVALGGGQRRVD